MDREADGFWISGTTELKACTDARWQMFELVGRKAVGEDAKG